MTRDEQTPGTVGVLVERQDDPAILWNQCDGPGGLHPGAGAGLRVCPGRTDTDRVLCIGSPVPAGGLGARTLGERVRALVAGRTRARLERAWDALGVERGRVDVLFYEPAAIVPDEAYAVARARARRVYGPDDRASHPIRLPVWWSLQEGVGALRAMEPGEKPAALACVTSGKRMIAGHGARLEFLKALRDAGVEMELYGRGLDPALGGRGAIERKSEALRPARYALAIENDARDPRYVTEKLWDALLCWCVPIYFGAGVPADLVPEGAVVRLPDLGAAGVERVRAALAAGEGAWRDRLSAVGEARRRVLGDGTPGSGAARLVEWYRREVWTGS